MICAAGAMLALAVGLPLGHWRAGLAVALGLLAGSANGFLARRALRVEPGFAFTSLVRLVGLSAVGLGIGAVLGLVYTPLAIAGIAAAQLVLAVTAAVLAVRTA